MVVDFDKSISNEPLTSTLPEKSTSRSLLLNMSLFSVVGFTLKSSPLMATSKVMLPDVGDVGERH